jgi:hypothetical protein
MVRAKLRSQTDSSISFAMRRAIEAIKRVKKTAEFRWRRSVDGGLGSINYSNTSVRQVK